MNETYAHAGAEPPLAELFSDPIVRAVMRRDGVDDGMLCRAIAIGRFRLGLAPADDAHAGVGWCKDAPLPPQAALQACCCA